MSNRIPGIVFKSLLKLLMQCFALISDKIGSLMHVTSWESFASVETYQYVIIHKNIKITSTEPILFQLR